MAEREAFKDGSSPKNSNGHDEPEEGILLRALSSADPALPTPLLEGGAVAALNHLASVHKSACSSCQSSKGWQKKLEELKTSLNVSKMDDVVDRLIRAATEGGDADLLDVLRADEAGAQQQSPGLAMTNTTNGSLDSSPEKVSPPSTSSEEPVSAAMASSANPPTIDDEYLADIQNLIMNDTGQEERKGQPQLHAQQPPQEAYSYQEVNHQPLPQPLQQQLVPRNASAPPMARKEKHMAPIDCTGLSAAFGLSWFCRRCETTHTGKDECAAYR